MTLQLFCFHRSRHTDMVGNRIFSELVETKIELKGELILDSHNSKVNTRVNLYLPDL